MTRAQRLAKALMTHHRGYEDEGPSIFSDAADELKRIAKERYRLREALRDAVAALGGITSDNVPETVRQALEGQP